MGKVNLKFIKRILIYGTGLMCLAFGVVFSVNSGLGVFLGVALSVIFFKQSGRNQGRNGYLCTFGR